MGAEFCKLLWSVGVIFSFPSFPRLPLLFVPLSPLSALPLLSFLPPLPLSLHFRLSWSLLFSLVSIPTP